MFMLSFAHRVRSVGVALRLSTVAPAGPAGPAGSKVKISLVVGLVLEVVAIMPAASSQARPASGIPGDRGRHPVRRLLPGFEALGQ